MLRRLWMFLSAGWILTIFGAEFPHIYLADVELALVPPLLAAGLLWCVGAFSPISARR